MLAQGLPKKEKEPKKETIPNSFCTITLKFGPFILTYLKTLVALTVLKWPMNVSWT